MLRKLIWFAILATLPAFAHGASPFVDVMTCAGMTGNGTTDDGGAINACLAANPSKTIYFPKRSAYQSPTPDYFSTQTFVPMGSGQKLIGEGNIGWCSSGHTCTTTIKFPAGVTGVDFKCTGCGLENLTLWGGEPFTSSNAAECVIPDPTGTPENYGAVVGTSSADGIRIRAAFVTVRNAYITEFGRHGIRGDGNSGNADELRLDNIIVSNNRGDGFNENGSDTNGSQFDSVRAYVNQINGLKERSFLGNTWIAPVAHTNHVDSSSDGPAQTITSIVGTAGTVTVTTSTDHGLVQGNGVAILGTTHYNGNYIVSSVLPGTTRFQVKLAGTIAVETKGAARLTKCSTTWATAGSDVNTVGGYNFPTKVGLNTLVGAFNEQDNPKAIFGPGNIIIGGNPKINWATKDDEGTPMIGNVMLRDGPGGVRLNQFNVSPYNGDGTDGPLRTYFGHMHGDRNAPDPFVMGVEENPHDDQPAFGMELRRALDPGNKNSPWFGWRTAFASDQSGLSNYSMLCAYGQTLEANRANPPCWFPNGFYIGSQGIGGQARQAFFSREQKPTTGEWLIGDKAWNANQATGLASGGFAGWLNVAPGSAGPGLWRAFAPVGTCDTGVWECPGTIGSTAPSSGAFTTLSATGQITSTQATGSAPITVSSTTPIETMLVANHPRVQACGGETSCSHTVITRAQIVYGIAKLLPGNSSTATITGIDPPFQSASSYVCTLAARSSTVAHVIRVANNSGSSFTITVPANVADAVNYICVGN